MSVLPLFFYVFHIEKCGIIRYNVNVKTRK